MKLPTYFQPTLGIALAIGLASMLSSCQTTRVSQFPTPSATWRTSIGQLQYVTPQRSVIGEAVVSRNGSEDFQLDFTAGPGVPLMRLRESATSARAEGLFARGSWQGDPARAPGPLARWMALREAFVAVDATASHGKLRLASSQSPAGSRPAWTAQASQGQPQRVRVQFPETDERFVFVFSK